MGIDRTDLGALAASASAAAAVADATEAENFEVACFAADVVMIRCLVFVRFIYVLILCVE